MTTAAADPADVPVHHLTNDPATSAQAYADALAVPGVVVLHDPSLFDLVAAVSPGGSGGEAFASAVERSHGYHPHAVANPEWQLPLVEVDGLAMPDRWALTMTGELAERSLAVLCPDPVSAARLQAWAPGADIGVVDLTAPAPAFAEQVEAAVARARRRAGSPQVQVQVRPGHRGEVNIVGDLGSASGLGEAARRLTVAAIEAGLEVSTVEVRIHKFWNADRRPPEVATRPYGKLAPIDLLTFNVNEVPLIDEALLDRYTIATWFWELPELPRFLVPYTRRVDEIWAPSRFVADTFRQYVDIPVRIVPCVAEPAVAPGLTRADLGLPPEGDIVLFTFDGNGSDARKNPWAAVEAYRRAVPPTDRGRRSHLVIKAANLAEHPALDAPLREAVGSVAGTVLDCDLANDEMGALLAHCDIYLSLHRSEGFGLGMAEAMALGKPVIATAFGGNVEFMDRRNSALVGYEARRIVEDDHRYAPHMLEVYEPGQTWAEPDVDQAARRLRVLLADPDERRRIGDRARADITARCGRAAVGRMVADRIRALLLTL